MAPSKLRLATASPATRDTTADTLAQLSRVAQRAAAASADILLLPEAYLGGYPRGAAFGCAVGSRTAAGRDEYLRYFQQAVDLGDTAAGAGDDWVRRRLPGDPAADDPTAEGGPDPATRRGDGTREELERVARDTGVFLVVGCVERAGGSLYCSVVYVCPRLGALGKRRKVMPTATERLIWAQGSPATLKAVSTTIRGVRVNMAAAVCWENYMPLLRQALYAQNVNLYLAPTADARDAWLALMRTVGVEGRCFVVSSNMCVRDRPADTAPPPTTSDEPAPAAAAAAPRARRRSVFDEYGNEIVLCGKSAAPEDGGAAPAEAAPGGWVCRGGSCIVSPFGDVLAGPQWEDDEGIIYADVDFEDCIRGRLDLDAAGSYSRNDSFNFSVQGLSLDPLPY